MGAAARHYTPEDIEALAVIAREQARRSFWAYFQYMNPKMKFGWWQRDAARHLQQFYEDLVAGKRPELIIQAPPQHGKSEIIVQFISWLAGKNPDLKTIYSSFSERLGVRANLKLQRIYDSERYQLTFPATSLNKSNVVAISGQTLRNREILEYRGRDGFFRNTTVGGPITGEGLDLGVIDDPIKGREAANSPTIRDKVWDWFNDDFRTRFSENSGFLCILTRWHVDDPIGRLIEASKNIEQSREDGIQVGEVKVLTYKAIATEDEEHRKAGQALFPEHKSIHFLLSRKRLMLASSWESLYQQNPIIVGGGFFPIDRFEVITQLPPPSEVVARVRYWDKAGTKDDGAYTAGVLLWKLRDGRVVVADVVRGQWEFHERERRMRQVAELDAPGTHIWIEQEPGSGGKESAQRSVLNLSGYPVRTDRVQGDKIFRAEPYAAQVQGGNVMVHRAAWTKAFLDEHEQFPSGKYKDQVDAAAGAFAKISVPTAKTSTSTVKGLY